MIRGGNDVHSEVARSGRTAHALLIGDRQEVAAVNPGGGLLAGDPHPFRLWVACDMCQRESGPLGEFPLECPNVDCRADRQSLRRVRRRGGR